AFEDRLERACGSAVAVDHHDLAISGRQLLEFAIDGFDDFLRIEVMHGGHAVDVHLPAALVHDRFDLFPERATNEQGEVLHRNVSSSGNCSTDTNESLKSERPDSSTYSILSGSSKAICRSRKERSDIFAPSRAVLPTDRMRS